MTKVIRRSLSRAYMQAHIEILVDENDEPYYITFVSYRSPIISIDLDKKMLLFYDTPVNYSRSTTQQTSCFARQVLPYDMDYQFLKHVSVKHELKQLHLTDWDVDCIKTDIKKVIDNNKNIKY